MTLVAIAIGLAIGPWLAYRLEGIEPRRVRRIQLAIAAVALVCGHALYVINIWPLLWARAQSLGPYEILAPWQGLHAPGAVLGMVLAGPWIFARFGVPLGKFADLNTPLLGIGLVTVRIGCFLQGCCFGKPCEFPWCVAFREGSTAFAYHEAHGLVPAGAHVSAAVHPLQLYFLAAALLLIVVSLWRYRRKRYDGEIALVGLLLFSISSTALEFMREESPLRVYVGPLPELAWIGLVLTAIALAGLLGAELAYRRRVRGASHSVPA